MLFAKDGLGLRALRATSYTHQDQTEVAEKLKGGDGPKKNSDPKKVFLGSTSLAPNKPRQQREATEPCLRGQSE